jgi:hypothetical protein
MARHLKLKTVPTGCHSAIQLAQQLAKLPHKIERTAKLRHLHLTVPPTGKNGNGVTIGQSSLFYCAIPQYDR